MLKPLPVPTSPLVTLTAGAIAGNRKRRAHRKVVEEFLVEVVARPAVHGIDHWRLSRHRHRLGHGAHPERLIELDRAADLDPDALLLDRGKTLQRERHGVQTRRQILEPVRALAVGDRDGRAHASGTLGFHGHADQHRTGAVVRDAADAARGHLRERRARE
jgi:hypothetical protein